MFNHVGRGISSDDRVVDNDEAVGSEVGLVRACWDAWFLLWLSGDVRGDWVRGSLGQRRGDLEDGRGC